ncbi:hypothetical protein Taro_019681 [Colocasia esculenta]|uniref:GTD-binding domain-containing protein n=1 Tax=Colocasia esculenta TaxID=4460 RepID=A0A843UXH2_COLES|nr:hypothetical protein [Colocasia esculenta]
MAACRAIHSWTFCALVGAFLDLALAYFMLCGAALAFFTAKFLGVFGLRLPCPCGGLFGRPTGHCLQHLLVEYPPRIVSSVQLSVRDRFPFDSVWAEEEGSPGQYDVKFVRDEAQSHRLLEMPREEEESCGSVSNSNAVKSQNLSSGGPSSVNKGDLPETAYSPWRPRDGSDVKGKGVISSLRPRLGLRRRRRAAAEQRRSSPILPFYLQSGWPGAQDSNYSTDEQMLELSGDNIKTLDSGDHSLPDNLKRPDSIGTVEGDTSVTGSNHDLTARQAVEKHLFAGSPEEHANVIRVLELALKEEKAARSALYLELEKERSAAATAADEAMAMILRLQKEKASIEMEARQYQRMIEEKSAYDEEEMDILKEIIVRREREKHFLEKEVELYRQMMVSGEGSEQQPSDEFNNMVGMIEQKPGCSFDFSDGPKFMEKDISNCDNGCLDNGPLNVDAGADGVQFSDHIIYKKGDDDAQFFGNLSNLSDHMGSVEDLKHGCDEKSRNFDVTHVKGLERSDKYDLEFQEKGMLTVDVYHPSQQRQTSRSGGDSSSCKLKENTYLNEASISVDKSGENCAKSFGTYPSVGIDWEKYKDEGEESCKSSCSQMESEQSVHDVHVIDDKGCDERNEKGSVSSHVGSGSVSSRTSDRRFESDGNRKIGIPRSHSSSSWLEAEQNVHRSVSDLTGVLLPLNTSHDSSSFSELRRNSMSAVGKERLKLETEVEHLRERLRIIQQGREKLNFSVENKDKENLQLQLLEEIASQLKEIRQLTEPAKAMRQASLPPSSSQAMIIDQFEKQIVGAASSRGKWDKQTALLVQTQPLCGEPPPCGRILGTLCGDG